MKSILSILALAALSAEAASTVGDVAFAHDPVSKVATITYTLGGDDAIVMLSAKTNGVAVADDLICHAGGDVNRLVRADGAPKTVTWRVLADLPEVDPSALEVSFKLWSKAHPPKYMTVDLDLGDVNYYLSERMLPDGGLTNDTYRTAKLVMALIPAAGNTFVQGSPTTEADRVAGAGREAQRLVSFTNDFYMGVFIVTDAQHKRICGGTADLVNACIPVLVSYDNLRGGVDDGINWPTTGHAVAPGSRIQSWRDKTGIDFDLPTSAQWEYACRAGCGDTWYWGGNHTKSGHEYDKLDPYAWTEKNSGNVRHRVGEKIPNAFGLYDMMGNVWEHCLDWAANITLPAAGQALVDPPGATATSGSRVGRGAMYGHAAESMRSAKVNPRAPNSVSDGYRLVCRPEFTW